MSPDALRAEHDEVLASLQIRESTNHFAHAAVSFFVAISLGGTAGKLWWDFAETDPSWWMTAAGCCAAVLAYSVTRFVWAFSQYSREHARVKRLLALRHQIGLDAPLALPAGK